MSGDDVRDRTAHLAAASSDDLCDKLAEVANHSDDIHEAMTGILRRRTQAGQI
jgi:hypothetical protein